MHVSNFFIYIVFLPLIKSASRMQLHMRKVKQETHLYVPKTIHQTEYVRHLNNDNTKIIISTGPAGCGKTLFACQKAIQLLKKSEINKIIITRPVVSVDEEIGFLPGNIIKKMDPWTKPMFDIFLEHYSKSELDLMLHNEKIEICPLAFMRGRTFKQSFIIADEMQNSSPNQMKMLTTRIGDGTRMVITGDLKQTDIVKENGLNDFVDKYKLLNDTTEIIQMATFTSDDIERSDVVKKVLEIYDYVPVKNPAQIVSNVETKNRTTYKIYNTSDASDAALIPIQHVTKYNDIFSDRIDF